MSKEKFLNVEMIIKFCEELNLNFYHCFSSDTIYIKNEE